MDVPQIRLVGPRNTALPEHRQRDGKRQTPESVVVSEHLVISFKLFPNTSSFYHPARTTTSGEERGRVNGVGSRFRVTCNRKENGLPENDSRPLPHQRPLLQNLLPAELARWKR
jgi:hypothetical protein